MLITPDFTILPQSKQKADEYIVISGCGAERKWKDERINIHIRIYRYLGGIRQAVEIAGLSRDTPIYHAASKDLRTEMMNEILYIAQHSQESPFHLIGHLYLFLDYFTRSSASMKLSQSGRIRDFYIKEALSYIEQNFQNEISVEDIAAFCGLNRSYFGKIFRETIGKSPQEFVIYYRMVKAAELLKLTDLSIADIGNAAGYSNWRNDNRQA